jgi:MFS family permease
MCGFSAFMVFTPLYARALGMHGAGLVLLVNALVLIAMRILGRTVPDRLGGHRAAAAGLVFGAIGISLPAITNDIPGLYLGAACFGAGHALLYPAVVMLTVAAARDDERSAAVGGLRASEAFGFAVSAPLLGVIAAHAGYRSAYGVAGVVTALGIAVLAVARKVERRRPAELTFDVR